MIVPMKWMTLVALKEDEESILHALQSLSAVQVVQTGEEAVCEAPDMLNSAENQVQKLSGSLQLLRPYAQKKSMFQPRPEVSVAALRDSVAGALEYGEQIEAISRDKATLRAQKEKAAQLIAALEPWAALETPIENIRETAGTGLFTGMLATESLFRLDELSDCAAVQVFDGVNAHAVLLLCQKADADRVESLLKQLEWNDFSFPQMEGTPRQAIDALDAQIKGFEAQEEAADTQLRALAQKRDEIEGAVDAAAIERDRLYAKAATGKTASAFLLEGWVRSDRVQEVEAAVSSVTDAYHMEMRDPTEEEVPPSVVQNNEYVTPYEAVTNLYSRPDPRSMDATPYMAPFYFLLFGMMVSDTGYGLVLAIGCFLFLKFMKPTGMTGMLTRVIMMGGISTILWGFLIGSFFGMDFDTVFGTANVFPLLLDPMSDPISMLFLCFGLGGIHILFGMVLKMKASFAQGDWKTAIFDTLSWIMVIIGLVLLLAVPSISTVGGVIAILGALTILFMKGRGKRNPLKRIVSGLAELYNVSGYLSDVLSYARLFALGIATGVIGSVFNTLGGMLMGADNIVLDILLTAIAIVLLIFLHLFNVGINTLGAFVHCARLQYIEFYGKFYETGGREFKPLRYNTRHVKVVS